VWWNLRPVAACSMKDILAGGPRAKLARRGNERV
jgi:hypothetical protein